MMMRMRRCFWLLRFGYNVVGIQQVMRHLGHLATLDDTWLNYERTRRALEKGQHFYEQGRRCQERLAELGITVS